MEGGILASKNKNKKKTIGRGIDNFVEIHPRKLRVLATYSDRA